MRYKLTFDNIACELPNSLSKIIYDNSVNGTELYNDNELAIPWDACIFINQDHKTVSIEGSVGCSGLGKCKSELSLKEFNQYVKAYVEFDYELPDTVITDLRDDYGWILTENND